MGFTLIKGKFKPLIGIPDGDSVRFEAFNNAHYAHLEGVAVRIGTGVETRNSVQLRFEGIDAIEKTATEPLATEAKENMKKLIQFDKVTNPEPIGYILTRMTDPHGRLVAYVFAGATPHVDGSNVFLDATLLGKSINYKQVRDGYAYPLYYNTLFATLRNKFNAALASAKRNNKGYWPTDKTNKGVEVQDANSLSLIAPIWPKLWRRLQEYLRDNATLEGFIPFLEAKNERIVVMPIVEERGLQDLVKVTDVTVKLTEKPENLVVQTVINR
jgi:endonuclease YncB( thermonuclease family)